MLQKYLPPPSSWELTEQKICTQNNLQYKSYILYRFGLKLTIHPKVCHYSEKATNSQSGGKEWFLSQDHYLTQGLKTILLRLGKMEE